jgi:hypothetical protein
MADADQQQAAPCDAVAAPFESAAAAVSQLFREHNGVLMGYLTTRLRSEQEAKEVAQEAYVRLSQLQEPGIPGLLRAYLFRTATNLAIDRLRHRRVRHRAEEQPPLSGNAVRIRGGVMDVPVSAMRRIGRIWVVMVVLASITMPASAESLIWNDPSSVKGGTAASFV